MSDTKRSVHGRVLITGGTGSWGQELCKQLLEKPEVREIVIFSRNEHKQVEMERRFDNSRLIFVIGDVRDSESVMRAMRGIDFVFHLAALKHVPVCEKNTWQTVETNIVGTHHVVMCALESGVDTFVDVSTDKAVEAHNIYGISKACGEKLVINAQHNYSSSTRFVCVRGGNVIGTNGSVVPLFKNQITLRNCITVTDPSMTRFLMSTREAVGLIFEAVSVAQGGEIFVMRMPAITVGDIAAAMVEKYGNGATRVEIIGSRPGEKVHEVLVSRAEAAHTYEWSEKYYVIIPEIGRERYRSILSKLKKTSMTEFSSQGAAVLSQSALKAMIQKEDWA